MGLINILVLFAFLASFAWDSILFHASGRQDRPRLQKKRNTRVLDRHLWDCFLL